MGRRQAGTTAHAAAPPASPETRPGVSWLRCRGHRATPRAPSSRARPCPVRAAAALPSWARGRARRRTFMHRRNPAVRFAPLALALALPLQAQERDPRDLDEVVVTATRTAITADTTLAAVEV